MLNVCSIPLSCLILCSPMNCSPPGSSVHGVLQARILEWVAITPGALPHSGIELQSPTVQADSLPSEPPGKQRNCKSPGEVKPRNPLFKSFPKNFTLVTVRWGTKCRTL